MIEMVEVGQTAGGTTSGESIPSEFRPDTSATGPDFHHAADMNLVALRDAFGLHNHASCLFNSLPICKRTNFTTIFRHSLPFIVT